MQLTVKMHTAEVSLVRSLTSHATENSILGPILRLTEHDLSSSVR